MIPNSGKRSVMILLLMGIFLSCNDGTQIKGNESDRSHETDGKESIKKFWDHFRNATRFRTSGKWQKAATEYREALKIQPDHEDALFYLGNMYLEMGDYPHAEENWVRITRLNPLSAKAHYQLGNLYLSYDREEFYDLDRAESEFVTTHRINRIITGPQLLLGHIMLIRGEYEEAARYFKSVLGSNSKNAEALFLLGYVHWKNNQYDEAMTYYSDAMERMEPAKRIKGVLSEGDTQNGKNHLRPINQSVFLPFYRDLNGPNKQPDVIVMGKKYEAVDSFLNELKKK